PGLKMTHLRIFGNDATLRATHWGRHLPDTNLLYATEANRRRHVLDHAHELNVREIPPILKDHLERHFPGYRVVKASSMWDRLKKKPVPGTMDLLPAESTIINKN